MINVTSIRPVLLRLPAGGGKSGLNLELLETVRVRLFTLHTDEDKHDDGHKSKKILAHALG